MTAISIGLVTWSIHAFVCNQRPVLLPYLFILYFAIDLKACTPDFRVHHVLGAAVATYGILVPDTSMMRPVYGTELSTPLYYALTVCPKHFQAPVRLAFFATFYVVRIHHYAHALLAWTPFSAPYPFIGVVGFYGLFGLNLYWFFLMLRKLARTLVRI